MDEEIDYWKGASANARTAVANGISSVCDNLSLSKLGSGFLQPESKATKEKPPKYPYNNTTLTESGHSLEFDDTPKRERVRLQHRSGTFIEMDPDGNETHKVYGNGYEIVIKDKKVVIKGSCSVTIEGDADVNIMGDKTERVSGDYNLVVGGKLSLLGKKDASFLSEGDVQIAAGGTFAPGDGAVRISSNEDVYITSSVMVAGTLNADMLYSKTTVDALFGMTAGFLGFVTLSGGVAVGLPIAIPGDVRAISTVNAPIGAFGVMTAILMTDTVNTKIYSTHFHTNKGASPPINPMI